MKTFLKNKKIMAGFLALALLLTGVISVLGFDNVIAYAMGSEEHWTKEDFLYSNETTIIAFSDSGMEKSKTYKTLSFPDGVVTINGNYSISHPDDEKRFEREFGRGKEWDKITIPDSVNTLGYAVFYEARTREVELSQNLKSLGGLAFFNNGLPAITLPEGLEKIEHNAFERNNLEEITIPKSVNHIDDYAFVRNKLHSIKLLGKPSLSEKGVFGKQVATYYSKQNPFYEEHFGYNGKFQVEGLPEEISYEAGAFSFLSDDIDSVTFEFQVPDTSYEGVITFVNSHKYSQGVQVDQETEDQGTQTDNPENQDQATQTKVEVLVKYIFEDGAVYKEDKVNADIGAVLDSGDLPMLPEDMQFTDDFLFYEVKEDGNVIERKVAKLTEDKEVQTEEVETDDASTQTEITQEDITKLEEKSEELSKDVEKLKEDLGKSEEISKEQKEKIEALEKEKADLKQELEEAKKLSEEANKKEESDENKACLEQVKALEEKLAGIDKTLQETNKIIKENKLSQSANTKETSQAEKTQPSNPVQGTTSPVETSTKELPKTGVQENEKANGTLVNTSNSETQGDNKQAKDNQGNKGTTLDTSQKESEKEIRYPNKLTPKQPANSTSGDMNGETKPVNTNKGVASDPSKARASVTENVDNANNDFPIHHGTADDVQEGCEDMPYYSADARQFVTFTTKNGKTFHLIINHDEDSENVMLLTEVSEDDLLNMVETKKETVKEEPVKVEEPEPIIEEPVKKEESSNAGTYLLVGLVIAGVLGAGYYLKVVKGKENNELAGFEEDDDYYSEAEDDYVDSYEEDGNDEEEDIDSEDLL